MLNDRFWPIIDITRPEGILEFQKFSQMEGKMDKMEMPKLIPIPIITKDKPIRLRVWRWMTSIRKWELNEDWEYKLPDDGTVIVIPKGFVFDGASIPRPLWGILSPTGLLLIPGLIHDFAYRYDYLWALDHEGYVYKYREESGQGEWDALFRKVGIHVNGIALIDILAWIALAILGWFSWRSHRKQKVPEIRPGKSIR